MKKLQENDILKGIEELIFRKLRVKAKVRAASLRSESRGYWHTNRSRCLELKARASKFDEFSSMIQEMVEDLPAYPSVEEKS